MYPELDGQRHYIYLSGIPEVGKRGEILETIRKKIKRFFTGCRFDAVTFEIEDGSPVLGVYFTSDPDLREHLLLKAQESLEVIRKVKSVVREVIPHLLSSDS